MTLQNIGIGFVIAASLILGSASVQSHQAPSGWQYDGYCCGNADCMPIDKSEYRDGRWYYSTRLGTHPIDKNTIYRPSGDNLTHLCVFQNRAHCIYMPPGN